MTERNFLFLLSSARADGNSEKLARHAAASLPPQTQQRWVHLAQLPLPPFEDIRHDGSGGVYPPPTGNACTLLDATLAATDLVFVMPVYWYSLPASVKLYLDHWSGWMRVAGLEFRPRMASRRLWGIISVSDEDRTVAEPLLDTLRLTASYMRMEFGGYAVGYGSRPADVLADADGLAQAAHLFAT